MYKSLVLIFFCWNVVADELTGCWRAVVPVQVAGVHQLRKLNLRIAFLHQNDFLDGLYLTDASGEYLTDLTCTERPRPNCLLGSENGHLLFRRQGAKGQLQVNGSWYLDARQDPRHPEIAIHGSGPRQVIEMEAMDDPACSLLKESTRQRFRHGGDTVSDMAHEARPEPGVAHSEAGK